jgi:hypothetical protein
MRPWHAKEVREIAEHLRRRLTAGQIARRYQGRTRMGVISLVNRNPDLREIGFQHSKIYPRKEASI